MPWFTSRALRKKLKECQDWLELGQKVYHYRRDVLPAADLAELERSVKELQAEVARGRGAAVGELERLVTALEVVLRRTGGSFYPRTFWAENVEMLLVAAILALGVRTYFIQPFKIPTNSMYPTYHGMTFEFHDPAQGPPNTVEKAFRFLLFGATSHTVTAPDDGELIIPLHNGSPNLLPVNVRGQAVPGRKWLVLPTVVDEYTLYLGQRPVKLQLPHEFSFDKVVRSFLQTQGPLRRQFVPGIGPALVTGRTFRRGDPVLSFDILTGDALFVDRFTYHFRPPHIGDPFVFRTDRIAQIENVNRGKYYIKRLVGQGGDRLQVQPPLLLRNDAPIAGAEAFERNAMQEGEYQGYTYAPRLGENQVTPIPEHFYYAMGDNSDESSDSRYWGFVPERDVVGKALFIYYPFTRRWGPSE